MLTFKRLLLHHKSLKLFLYLQFYNREKNISPLTPALWLVYWDFKLFGTKIVLYSGKHKGASDLAGSQYKLLQS